MLSFKRCFFVGFVVCSLMGFGSTPTLARVDIAYYRFEEGTAGSAASGNGTILDSSGNGLNGTAINGPEFSANVPTVTIPISGVQNLASLSFNGINQRIFIPDDPRFELTRSLTLEAFVYQKLQPSWYGQIIMRGDDRSDLDPFFIGIDSSDKLVFRIQDGYNNTMLLTAEMPSYNQWVHVAGTIDDSSGAMRLYINGALEAEAFTNIRPLEFLDSNYSPGIGIGNVQSPNYGQYFPGLIDEVRISDQALRPDQFLNSVIVPEPGSLNLVLMSAIGFSFYYFRKFWIKIPVHNCRMAMITLILTVVMCSEKTSYGWADIVYGTGVLNDGASASFGSIDMHYQITAAKDFYTGEAIPLADQNSYPVDYPGIDSRFVNASDNARWICPAPVNTGFPIGWYTFSTTFDLTGHDPNTFSISGDWAMDNCSNGPSMMLNGNDTGNNLDITNESFLQLYPFTITSGFQTGLNTLDFVVFNWGGPTALLVSMQSSAAYSVPETSSVMMAVIGLLFITAMVMKRFFVHSGDTTVVCASKE